MKFSQTGSAFSLRLDRALARVLELEKQVEGLSMDAEQLQREIAHLKMQKDILVKSAEVLKKDGAKTSFHFERKIVPLKEIDANNLKTYAKR